MTARYTLYGIWLSGPAYKIGLMLTLAGEKFDYQHTGPRDDAKKAEFLAMNRFGQVPLLTDNENGRHFCQSAAILEYLADTTKKFRATSPAARQQVKEWMYWEFDRLAAPIFRLRGQRLGFRSIHQATAEMYFTEGNAALKVLDDQLAGKSWLVGRKATIADIDVYGVVSYASAGGFDLKKYKSISKWMKRFEALPGFGTAEEILPKVSRKA
ncbi:MAG: glutathione S-transferase family protein [Bosea sp. (in: a-proteobacteria)]